MQLIVVSRVFAMKTHHPLKLCACLALAGLFSLPVWSQVAATALPTGAVVAAGQAQVSQKGNVLQVNQASSKAIINWQSFNIGKNAQVQFVQPNSSAIALNRVGADGGKSIIDGQLTANGQVWLLNPGGVLFSNSARVDVGGVVASTLKLNNDDFLSGNYRFYRDGSTGSLINQGTLTAADGGYVALLAPEVRNEGVITARLGTVALATGEEVRVDFAGDRLVEVVVDKAAVDGLIENKHLITADGGMVLMSTDAASRLAAGAINQSGVIQAQTLDNHAGVIKLLGGETRVAGLIDASAPQGGDGGFIETSGHKVHIAPSFRVTTLAAKGKTGLWLIDPSNFYVSESGGDLTGTQVGEYLASSNFTIDSTAGSGGADGDIWINDPISWSSGNTLTLDAYRNINVNANITSSAASTANLILLAGANITLNANTQIRSDNGPLNVTLNADKNGSENGFILLNDSSKILSKGGAILLAGGLDAAGYATSSSASTAGVHLLNAELDSEAGEIMIRGNASGHAGIYLGTGTSLHSTSGQITLNGISSFIEVNAAGVLLNEGTSIRTDSGNINITGEATGTGTVWGISSLINTDVPVSNEISSSSGAVSLKADSIRFYMEGATPNLTLQTAGTLSIEPKNSNKSMGIGTGDGNLQIPGGANFPLYFLPGFSSITLGGSETGYIKIGDISYYDNLTIYSGKGYIDFRYVYDDGLGQLLKSTLRKYGTKDVDLYLKSAGSIEAGSETTIDKENGASGKINVTFHSDADGNDTGLISITGSTIASNGGNIVLGGGLTLNPNDPYNLTTGYATGENGGDFGDGIRIDGSTLNAANSDNTAGGNIFIKGRALDSGGKGVWIQNGHTTSNDVIPTLIKTAGTGNIHFVGAVTGNEAGVHFRYVTGNPYSDPYVVAETDAGSLRFTTDTLVIEANTKVKTGSSGYAIVEPLRNTTYISLGGTDSNNSDFYDGYDYYLALSNEELARFETPLLHLGNSSAKEIYLYGDLSHATTKIKAIAAGDIYTGAGTGTVSLTGFATYSAAGDILLKDGSLNFQTFSAYTSNTKSVVLKTNSTQVGQVSDLLGITTGTFKFQSALEEGVALSQTSSGRVTAGNFVASGTGSIHLNTATSGNAIGTVAASLEGGDFKLFNGTDSLTVGTLNDLSDVARSGIQLNDRSGFPGTAGVIHLLSQSDLFINEAISTSNTLSGGSSATGTTSNAIYLNAGGYKVIGALGFADGNIIFGANGSVTTGAAGRAVLYTGGLSGSNIPLAVVATGNARYFSDTVNTNYTQAVGDSGVYAIFREQPTLTVSVQNESITYGNPLPTYTASISGFVRSDTGTFSPSYALPSATYSSSYNLNAGSYSIVASGAVSTLGYGFSYQPGTLTVAQQLLSVINFSIASKVYDGTTQASINGTPTLSGSFLPSDNVNFDPALAVATFANKNVGTGKSVTYAHTLTGTDAGNYTIQAETPLTANISAKLLMFSGLTASNKTYDGTTSATIGGTAVLENAITPGTGANRDGKPFSGDAISLSGTPIGVFNSKNVLAASSVDVSGLTLSGDDAGNYMIPSITLAANILTKALTLSGITASNKTYDGTTSATVDASSLVKSGLVNGDVLTVSSVGAFANKNVGTAKTVTLTNTLGGADLGNYTVTDQTSTTADISAAQRVTWTGGGGNALWSNAANWGGVIPSGNNVLNVVIPAHSVEFDAAAENTYLQTLTVQAGGQFALAGSVLDISSALTTPRYSQSGGTLSGTGSLTVSESFSKTGGTIQLAGPLTLTQNSGDLQLTNDYRLLFGALKALDGNIDLETTGGLATTLRVDAVTGSVRLVTHSPLTIGSGGISAATGVTLAANTQDSGSTVTLSGPISSSAGPVSLAAYGNISQNAGASISAGTGNIDFVTTQGSITQNAAISAPAGRVGMAAFGNIVQNGNISASSVAVSTTTGNITIGDQAVTRAYSISYAAPAGMVSYNPVNFSGAYPTFQAAILLDATGSGDDAETAATTVAKQETTKTTPTASSESNGNATMANFPKASEPEAASLPPPKLIVEAAKALPTRAGVLSKTELKEMFQQIHEAKTVMYGDALSVLAANPRAADVADCGSGAGLCIAKSSAPVVSATSGYTPEVKRRVALLIGNNAYRSPIPELETAVGDVEAIAEQLRDKLGYEIKVVKNAGRVDIVEALNELIRTVDRDDSVMVMYAGHGYLDQKTGAGYWIPSDASPTVPDKWISNDTIARALGNIPAKQVMLVSDSCYSGSLTKEGKVVETVGVSREQTLTRRSVLALSSGGEEPVSDEGQDNHSIFAWNMIQSLKNLNDEVAGKDFHATIKEAVTKEFPQVPQYGTVVSAGHTEGGEYLLTPKSMVR